MVPRENCNDVPEQKERQVPREVCIDEPKETCEQKPQQVTSYDDERSCQDITTISCKPVTTTNCHNSVEKVSRQQPKEVSVVKPEEKCFDEKKTITTTRREQECKKVKPGDVYLVKYEKKVGEAGYRLSKVESIVNEILGILNP